MYCFPKVAGPCDVLLARLPIGPHRIDVESVFCVAILKSRVRAIDSSDGSAKNLRAQASVGDAQQIEPNQKLKFIIVSAARPFDP
jgi:hypothetical protein